MKKLLLIAILLNLFLPINSQEKNDYKSSFEWGIILNSNGGIIGGTELQYNLLSKKKYYHYFGLELVNTKHLKESRQIAISGKSFLFGKKNYLINIRPQYGRSYRLFNRVPERGVQVNFISSIGPTIGLESPYYLKFESGGSGFINKRFVPDVDDPNGIYSVSPLGASLSDAKIKMGLNIKVAFNFELSLVGRQTSGFEAGFVLDAFASTPEIMYLAPNKRLYPAYFITFFWGMHSKK